MMNKTILITGGTSGIGFACADFLLKKKYQVIITGRTKSNLDIALKNLEGDITGYLSDVSKIKEIEILVDKVKTKFKKIDGLFVNAGIFKASSFEDTTEKLFDETMNINFKGAFFTVQKFIPLLNNPSSVVLNTSIVVFKAFADTSVYTASMFVKIHGLHKLKLRLYTKLVSNLVDDSLFLKCFSLKKLITVQQSIHVGC